MPVIPYLGGKPMQNHFALQFAVRLAEPDRHEKALPPVFYDPETQCFKYDFNGQIFPANEIFSDHADDRIRQELKSMSLTQGSTGRRDYCWI